MRRAVLYAYNSISNIFITIVCLTKKYGEFKSATDFERARHFLEINFSALANGAISFDLFNYELWIADKKLQPVPFKNCYAAIFDRTPNINSLVFSDVVYQQKRALIDVGSPQFKQLVEGIQALAPQPDPSGVVNGTPGAPNGTPGAHDGTLVKNITASTIADKLESSKLKPLYNQPGGDYLLALETSINVAKDVPTEAKTIVPAIVPAIAPAIAPAISELTSMLTGEPLSDPRAMQAIFAGGGAKHHPLTRKRVPRTSSSSLLLFTKRNRHPNHQLLKQKKRTIKKGSRKKRHNEMKKKKSIKKRG